MKWQEQEEKRCWAVVKKVNSRNKAASRGTGSSLPFSAKSIREAQPLSPPGATSARGGLSLATEAPTPGMWWTVETIGWHIISAKVAAEIWRVERVLKGNKN